MLQRGVNQDNQIALAGINNDIKTLLYIWICPSVVTKGMEMYGSEVDYLQWQQPHAVLFHSLGKQSSFHTKHRSCGAQ